MSEINKNSDNISLNNSKPSATHNNYINSYSKHNYNGIKSSIFGIFVLLLFIIAFSHYVRTGTFVDFSFKSLIDYLSTMPDISMSFYKIDLKITSDWYFFNFFRDFLNLFTPILQVFWTIGAMFWQAIIVVFWFLGLFFI